MLARTFLRFAALEALRPSTLLETGGPWPTLAGAAVYDSRFDPIDDLAPDERRPTIVVYTDQHNLDAAGQSGQLLYRGVVDLVIEIAVVEAVRDDNEGDVLVYAVTDAELETKLDLLEAQVSFALHVAPSGRHFRRMTKLPLRDWNSVPDRSSEEAIRYARRTIRAQAPLHDDCWVAIDPYDPLSRLPPRMREVVEGLGESAYVHQLAIALAGAAPALDRPEPLESVDLTVWLTDPPAAQGDPAVVHVQARAEIEQEP